MFNSNNFAALAEVCTLLSAVLVCVFFYQMQFHFKVAVVLRSLVAPAMALGT